MPGIQVKEFFHRDGTRFIAITRGSWAWMKLQPSEVRRLADELHDLMDEIEGKK